MTVAPSRRQPASPSTAPTLPTPDLDAAIDAERDALRALFPLPPARPARSSKALRSGAAALLVTVGAAALLWVDPAWRTEHYASAMGERRSVHLTDGSALTLDTATALDVTWHLRSRRVVLLRGQARFEVARSRLQPFRVAAGQVGIRVVGTVFDVRRDAAQVRITVLQGRVRVSTEQRQPLQLLLPGQRLRIDLAAPAAAALPQAVDAAEADAWLQGRLVLDRTPLREALAEVQRYRSAPIRLHDDGTLGSRAVSGVFDTARTDQLLNLLPRIVPAQVQRQPDGSVDIHPSGG